LECLSLDDNRDIQTADARRRSVGKGAVDAFAMVEFLEHVPSDVLVLAKDVLIDDERRRRLIGADVIPI